MAVLPTEPTIFISIAVSRVIPKNKFNCNLYTCHSCVSFKMNAFSQAYILLFSQMRKRENNFNTRLFPSWMTSSLHGPDCAPFHCPLQAFFKQAPPPR